MSAQRFLELLEDKGMLESTIVDELRRLTIQKKATAEVIAKVLVDKGHLTRFQATKLVGEATASAEERREAKAVQKQHDEDFIGLAPDDDLPSTATPSESPSAEDSVVLLEPAVPAQELEEVAGLTPVEDAGAGLTPVTPPTAPSPVPSDNPLEPLDLDTVDPFAAAAGPSTLPTRGSGKRNIWDTKLMVGGGLALLLLLLIGGAIYWNLMAVPADERWRVAMEDYRGGSYSQASEKFETFLSKFPKDDRASEARVRLVLSGIRIVLSDPVRGLAQARESLPTIESEDAVKVAREELATMLIEIPEAFLKQAKAAEVASQKQQLVEQTEEGIALIDNPTWVPSSQRRAIQHRIHELNEGLTLVRRDLNQDRDLSQAIGDIRKATQSNNTVRAYQVYKELINRYPGLTHHSGLVEALKAATEGERALVKVTQERIEPLDAVSNETDPRMILASRTGGDEQQLRDRVATILADGSVYGLEAGTGKVLWGHFVGHGTLIQPVRTSNAPGSDVLLVDGVRGELICLASQSGNVNWRLPVGDVMSAPVVAGKRVYVTVQSGKLLEVDVTTGVSTRQAATPLSLSVSTAIASDRPQAFQLAEHSNLYVLATDSLQCVGVHYLGHKAGTAVVPPLAQMNHVFVAENYATGLCRLHVLRLDGESHQVSPAQSPIELKGNVVVPLQKYGRRLLATTDLGEIRVLDVDLNRKPPCSPAAVLAPTLKQPLAAYPLSDAGTLWVADNRLAKYRVQITTGKVTRQAVTHGGDVFTAPLQLFGNLLVHTRKQGSSAGVTITGIDIDSPRKPLWRTQLGVPAGRVHVEPEGNRIQVVSAAAALFDIGPSALGTGPLDRPSVSALPPSGAATFTQPIELDGARMALFSSEDPSRLLVFEPGRSSASRLRLVRLDLPDGKVTCTPIALADALLVPMSTGEVLLRLDGQDREVLPFQPKLVPGQEVHWSRPAVLGDQFVISDDQRNIYRVGVQDNPRPFMKALARARLDFKFNSPLVAAGQTVYGAVRTASTDMIVAIEADNLEVGQEWDLEGRVTWGPERIGDNIFLVSNDRYLHCFQPGQKRRWSTPSRIHGRPVGPPLQIDGDYVFASQNGMVWRISANSGEELSKVEVGEPLSLGPVAFRDQLLLGGKTGALRVISMPAGS